MGTDRNCNLEGLKKKRAESSTSRGDNCVGLGRVSQSQKVLGSNGLLMAAETI